jgi:hypothetical protein
MVTDPVPQGKAAAPAGCENFTKAATFLLEWPHFASSRGEDNGLLHRLG